MSVTTSSHAIVGVSERFYPAITAILYVLIVLIRIYLPKQKAAAVSVNPTKQKTLAICSWVVFLLFVLEALLLAIRSHVDHGFTPSESTPVYVIGSAIVWLCLSILLHETNWPYWPAYLATWASTAIFDGTSVLSQAVDKLTLSPWDSVLVVQRLIRTLFIVSMVTYGILYSQKPKNADAKSDEETRSLLSCSEDEAQESGNGGASHYGALGADESDSDDDDDDSGEEDEEDQKMKEIQRKRVEEQGGWVGYLKGFLIFLPYILPYKDRHAQMCLLAITICVIIQRFLIVMIPQQLGDITEAMGHIHGTGIFPWKEILIWGLLKFPGFGVTTLIREMASSRVSQYSYRELKSAAFAHVMNLSMDYHTEKSSGKLTKAIEQGTDLNMVMDNVFTAGPMFIDLTVAAFYLTSTFDVYMGFIILTTSILHIYATLKTNSVTVPLERVSADRQRAESEVLYDSVTNWQTVAYHNRRKFEQDRYATAVRNTIITQRRYFDWIDYGRAGQTFILDAGLVLGSCLAAARVAAGTSDVSSFVFFVVYWSEIREPMAMISWTFHDTAAHLINAEWLFQLLQNKPSVQDKPNAPELSIEKGKVEFNQVSFSYDPKRPILNDISFTASPGQSVALVGETGGGKSTILKLLWRFYDPTSGSIKIDDQDLRDVTLDSLRDALGAVPQEPSVFDQTILDNVRYAHPDATRDDVLAACKAAQIHDQIMKFPDGYNTRLGERGVRLSGGELQRLAIARVILRKPKIVILDEATSAVDSGTEASVQKALKILSAGRTVFTVAHRLSTIVSADIILVLDQGRIIERGSHQELLDKNGKYFRLWSMQIARSQEHDREDIISNAAQS